MTQFLQKIIVFFICVGGVFSAHAQLQINVSGAHSNPIPFALPKLEASWSNSILSNRINKVVIDDLNNSGLFRYIDKDAYIQRISSINDTPQFNDWQAINAQVLIYGNVDDKGGDLSVSFRIFDIYAQSQLEATTISAPKTEWRKMAHMMADFIYEKITGETGYFDTQIVYIDETGTPRKPIKRVALIDQDGQNVQYLTDGKDLVLTPRFSPNMTDITYFSYKNGNPKVYLMNLKTRATQLVGDFPNMTFAPNFSPDGKLLIMSLTKAGNSNIYTYDLATKKQKKLTNHPSINTSPSYSPDGSEIVFNSDRSGNQQLYIMDKNGNNTRRISFGKGTYATPVWSTRGDYIAFTKITNGQFHIGIIKPDGTGERLITNGFLVESPTWAPNGRVLMFYRQTPSDENGNGSAVNLYSIDITGYNEQLIITPNKASDPAWSPLLH